MKSKSSHTRLIYLGFITFVAAMGGFLFGFDTAVISGVVGFVKAEFLMSSAMEGWFVSSALLGCIIGVVAAGRLSDEYGRKKVLVLSAVLFCISAVGCMLAKGIFWLISFRLIGGMGIGAASIISPLYISEFSPPKLRGRTVSIYQLAITLGILCAYFSNSKLLAFSATVNLTGRHFFNWIVVEHVWRSMLGIGVVPAAVFLISLIFIRESPRWLLMKNRHEKAKKILSMVNEESDVENEILSIRNSFHDENVSVRDLFTPVYRKAIIIGVALAALSQFSGINAVIYFGPRILDEAGFTLDKAFGGQVTIGIVNTLFTLVAIFTIDRWGRKPLLLFGVSLSIVALIIIGLLFYLDIENGPWILGFILVFIASFAFSFGPISWVIISEIFPTSIRGRAMALSTLSLWFANFLVGQLTPLMLDGAGPTGTFWVFALLCSPTIWLVVKLIPETKGRSLEEIEDGWRHAAIGKESFIPD